MSEFYDERRIVDRQIADIDNQISQLQAEGRDNGDSAIRHLLEHREKLLQERETFYGTAPVERQDRDDPFAGHDRRAEPREEAGVQTLRR